MRFILLLFVCCICVVACDKTPQVKAALLQNHIRHQEDTIGFAQYSWQMDSIISRMDDADKLPNSETYKAVICPHDDYGYAGGLYYKTLSGIKAKTIILVGVAHRARNFDLQDRIIFGSYDSWQSPDGIIPVSNLRDKLLTKLKKETYVVHDSMMQLEHSLEAITPFLKRKNPALEIIPMLVPYNTFQNMQLFSDDIGSGIAALMKEENLIYGKDIAVVISNDAIHYGSEGWGSGNLAPFGTDSIGTAQARQKDFDIIATTLQGELTTKKVKKFNNITIMDDDYKSYKWTWCGRYSTPFGLLLANRIEQLTGASNKDGKLPHLTGTFIDWRSSLHNTHIKVDDLHMGHTAQADSTHWVAYVGMSYQ